MTRDRWIALAAALLALVGALGTALDWWGPSDAERIREAGESLRGVLEEGAEDLDEQAAEERREALEAAADLAPMVEDAAAALGDGDAGPAPAEHDASPEEGTGVPVSLQGLPAVLLLLLLPLLAACGAGGPGVWRYVEGSEAGGGVCFDVKIVAGPDGPEVEWSAELCSDVALKGVPLPDICASWGEGADAGGDRE